MFGKRGNEDRNKPSRTTGVVEAAGTAAPSLSQSLGAGQIMLEPGAQPPRRMAELPSMAADRAGAGRDRGEAYYDTKSQVFAALIDTIDLSQLAKLEAAAG